MTKMSRVNYNFVKLFFNKEFYYRKKGGRITAAAGYLPVKILFFDLYGFAELSTGISARYI